MHSFSLLPRIIGGLLLVTAATAGARTTPPKPLPVRGWLVHSPDAAYLKRVLAAAPAYRVNHLELSHDVVMNIDELVSDPARARQVEQVAREAAVLAIKTYVWAHELNTREKDLRLNPRTEAGGRFWDGRAAAYRAGLRACPSVAGVVLMFGSSPTEVWDAVGEDGFWRELSMPERVRFVTGLVRSVVVGEFGKELLVRDFSHGPRQLDWLVEGVRDVEGLTLLSKPEPQDFQPFYPHSPSLGAFGSAPQVLEMDLNGEYWGQSLMPVSQVGYLRYRLRHAVARGIKGAVGRIDTYDRTALSTPNEINLYAFSRLLENPDLPEATIYDEWIEQHYRLKPGRVSARMRTILERTWTQARKCFYTLGFWTWKDQAFVPDAASRIDRGIAGKSTALWDPSAKRTEERLLHPDPATVRAILTEKAEAVALADRNVREAEALADHLPAADAQDLLRRLRLASDWARVYEAIASAYWRTKLAAGYPEAAPAQRQRAIRELESWALTLEQRYAGVSIIREQGRRLRRLAADLRRQAGSGPL